MDPHMAETTLKACLTEMRTRLEKAVSIAKAAEICAASGNIEKGVEVALDLEPMLYEVTTFLNAASLLKRVSQS